ncbi:endonuclease/exonuclease/phosphatase family protein [Salinivibrio sp. ES.052]|uniref:endonuclease/exonuclease/phosphatase family protein n=1 Tax=Salinivibrio sp. ES.052 TaxID=1882823 RepID=UPI00092632DC|nr:endonuclease/exonuclease/phosphatase family protein [Salinivibrio sp. ES.052]SIO31860.1 Metal-dependent hydrolase, endonuclease/exonuclease/phosphatase family [Salinivibrio sp. ES.052]
MLRLVGLLVLIGVYATPSYAFTVATWNFEWLTLKGDQRAGIRHADDYQQLAAIFSRLSPDVLAFQEVDSPDALARVVPKEKYNYYFSDRYTELKPSQQSQQLTGIAVRKEWQVEDPNDLREIALPGFFGVPALRYGAYLVITPPNQEPIHMMSVHLKSGCFHQSQGTRSCDKLGRQFKALAQWVADRGDKNVIIAGDFNRYIGEKNDPFWQRFNTHRLEIAPRSPHIINVTKNVRARCKARRYNWRTQAWNQVMYSRLVDHILVSQPLTSRWQYSFQHHFAYHNVMTYRLSDHCPVVAKFESH